jgi:hypothetical protein
MPTERIRFAREGRDLSTAKASARQAFLTAKQAGGLTAVSAERYWSETLAAAEGAEAVTAAEMYRRSEHLLVLLIDREKWAR